MEETKGNFDTLQQELKIPGGKGKREMSRLACQRKELQLLKYTGFSTGLYKLLTEISP